MSKKYFVFCCILFLFTLSVQHCLTDSQKKPEDKNTNGQNGFNESFRKTGWISESKYRAVVFIITGDECRNSPQSEIEEKIKFEAFKNLQKELNPAFNRNASNHIKNLADNSGKIVRIEKGCAESNIYFFDLEKINLKNDFEKIKNLK